MPLSSLVGQFAGAGTEIGALIEMVPLEHCLENSGEPDLIIDRGVPRRLGPVRLLDPPDPRDAGLGNAIAASARVESGGNGKLFFERLSSGKDDVRLFAICQPTIRLHGGHVSIAGDQANPGIQPVLPKAGTEEGRYG